MEIYDVVSLKSDIIMMLILAYLRRGKRKQGKSSRGEVAGKVVGEVVGKVVGEEVGEVSKVSKVSKVR